MQLQKLAADFKEKIRLQRPAFFLWGGGVCAKLLGLQCLPSLPFIYHFRLNTDFEISAACMYRLHGTECRFGELQITLQVQNQKGAFLL